MTSYDPIVTSINPTAPPCPRASEKDEQRIAAMEAMMLALLANNAQKEVKN